METLYMLIGVPGSGKSTFSKNMTGVCVTSSDTVRRELFGDLNNQDSASHRIVFDTMNNRTKENIEDICVVYDATNLNRKKRINFRNEVLKGGDVHAVVFIEPISVLLERNAGREGDEQVPEDKIRQMYGNFNIPKLNLDCSSYHVQSEHNFFNREVKYNDLLLITNVNDLYVLMTPVYQEEISKVFGPHDTPYHLESIDEHIDMCISNSNDDVSHIVSLFHDLGKSFTKDGGKYFGHQNVSAMYAMKAFSEIKDMENEDIILETIYQHMIAHKGISNKVIRRYKLDEIELKSINTFVKIDNKSRIQ